jgi:SPASM domain peptide maturase of grasp-with-spasm system
MSFIVKYQDNLTFDKIPDIFKSSCFFELIVHSAPSDFNHKNHIIYTSEKIYSCSQCGKVCAEAFSVNKEHLAEAQSYNTCLNRKLCIDHNGNIKNCLAMDKIFGNILEDDIIKIVNSSDFQSLWQITKDQIEVCKDCEFRYICTDCRCFIKDPDNIYSQPAKCGYNPYIAKWKDQDGYVPVEEYRIYSKETDERYN